MARRRTTQSSAGGGAEGAAVVPELIPGVLITFRPETMSSMVSRLQESVGIKNVAFAADFGGSAVDMAQARQAGMTVFNTIGVAVADVDPDQEASLSAAATADAEIASIEPEPIYFAFADGFPPTSVAYLRGYRDAVNHLHDRLIVPGAAAAAGNLDTILAADAFQDTDEATWGLAAARILESRDSGRAVRVAILDTGLDLDHPDFRGRQITSQSFIPGQLDGSKNLSLGTGAGRLIG